jgi:hypothetical protein
LESSREATVCKHECIFLRVQDYYTQEVSSSFGDSVNIASIKQKRENGEMLVNVRSIFLPIFSSIEEQENDEEEEHVCVGT